MRIIVCILVSVAFITLSSSCTPGDVRSSDNSNSTTARNPDTPPAGFHALFDGTTLDGWWGCGMIDPRVLAALDPPTLAAKKAESLADVAAHWTVTDGVIVNDGEGLYLTTDRDYEDFILQLEYRTVAGADSGIYLRGVPQVQIWDTTEAGGKWNLGARSGSGGLWNNAEGSPGRLPLVHADRPFGEWNQLEIVMVGERVTVSMNDQLIVDHAPLAHYFDQNTPLPRRGPIQLQTHGGEIAWRRIWLREIGPEEANEGLAMHAIDRDRTGVRSLFDGKSLEGWKGAVDGYEVVNGAISCRAGSGGTLYHGEELSDFEVTFEFRLPPGGNNGLAIRYPGEGDTAYSGMCELQVLHNDAEKYETLDPRQYHGSAYGMVAAHRGYLRSPGLWNFQRVRVVGSTIEVELNGTQILDADLSQVTEAMYPLERFAGRLRTRGYFGFAGHGDPVSFRKISVRDLDPSGMPRARSGESRARSGESRARSGESRARGGESRARSGGTR